ncbi:hypothetical protein BH10PSE9_BH10PSE9_24290 [soil metagenome]
MSKRVRKELWLGLVIFPATFAIAKAIELLLSEQGVRSAVAAQARFIADLASFTPLTFVGRIWESVAAMATIVIGTLPDFTDIDSIGAFLARMLPFIIKLPLLVIATPIGVIGSVWQNDTWLATVIVTLTFLLAVPTGIAIAGKWAEGMGFWGLVPVTIAIYLVGTLICTFFWGVTWFGLTIFGWITSFAGYCTLCGGFVTAGYVAFAQYAGFRAAHSAENVLKESAGEEDHSG